MADKSSHSPSPGVNGGIDEKTRLTEEEKKQNHIASGIYFLRLSCGPRVLC